MRTESDLFKEQFEFKKQLKFKNTSANGVVSGVSSK